MARVCPDCHRCHTGDCPPVPTLKEMQAKNLEYLRKVITFEEASKRSLSRNTTKYAMVT